MKPKGNPGRKTAWPLPGIGQRMIKTTVAVFICLVFYCILGYRGQDMPTEAAITAIVCMQPYVRDSREYALNRMTGTLIGASWGLLLLLLLLLVPALGTNLYIVYGLMALGVLMSLYTAVAFHKPDASSLSAIVFICIVISFPDIDDPLRRAFLRISGVIIGTAVAVCVNVFRLPRSRNRDKVFFIQTADLVPDRFSQISPTVLFRLNSLHQDGAKICFISRHAPAFFISQLHSLSFNLPMIVMDGAALYDVNENRYLQVETIREADSAKTMERLDRLGLSYFLYTIHNNRTCIFHRGAYREQEREVLNRLRRTPYRSYLDEEIYNQEEIVCIKVIGGEIETRVLSNKLHTYLRCKKLRSAIQPQAGVPGVSALYIYSERATVHHAENKLLQLLPEGEYAPEEVFLPRGYRSEHDAMVLLYQILNRYAPIRFFHLPRRKK